MSLESGFHLQMVNIYIRARKECGYNATRFLQMLDGPERGVSVAKRNFRL